MLHHVDVSEVKTIVIVDDETSFTDLLDRLFREHFSCPIHIFSHPDLALTTLPSLNAGLLVTDFYMPGMSGLDLIVRARGQCPQTPCILITAHAFDADEQPDPRLAHCHAVLAKPFRWRQLADLIREHWPEDSPLPLRTDSNLR